MFKHKFGGIWTRKKIVVLKAYLEFYVLALKNQPFTLHYADAFAGTGRHNVEDSDGEAMLIPMDDLKGSVLTALEVSPDFDVYHFNDLNSDHVLELKKIKANHPGKVIEISQKDANVFVEEFCNRLGSKDRAVVLIDPYSTEFDWKSLEYLAKKKIDLWLLFPISVILRMTPRDGDRLKPEWRNTLNRLLGTNEWESELYKPKELLPMDDLFGQANESEETERVNVLAVQEWVTNRLKGTFPFVASPIPLKNKGKTLFLFFFAVSNPSKKAWGLAQKAANQIIKKNIGND